MFQTKAVEEIKTHVFNNYPPLPPPKVMPCMR